MRTTIDFGIDLGTSNSAIALQDGAAPRLLEASDGSVLLPSAIHIRADGSQVIGAAAIKARRDDPANTAIEFKRQMGTGETLSFPASGRSMSAIELSAAILRNLAERAERLEKAPLRAAVITVPAMFQLAQCEATRQAANLAGIEHAPLLQEPIAAAMAHAGAGHAREGHWLVYDLGGGTFDVSLVRARAGRLQVLDHDGDNHLGGKDFNRVLARWASEQVRLQGLLGEFRRSDPVHANAFARISAEAERVRVRLSEVEQEEFIVRDLAKSSSGEPVHLQLSVDRGQLEALIIPTIIRTTELCKSLLARNRMKPAELKGIVLVGGPTRTPCVTAHLQHVLGLEARHAMDPTTIVAAGAALFAATEKLPANLRSSSAGKGETTSLALEYESMTTNPAPLLVGRVEGSGDVNGLTVRVRGADGAFDSGAIAVQPAKRAFAVPLKLKKGELNVFDIALMKGDKQVPAEPTRFSILHGMSVSKPPLSQSVGVMLADNSVCWYLRKGAVLPARNTIAHATTVPLHRGQSGDPLKVPLIQGESERADRNKIIGILCIHAEHITRNIPAGTEIQVTLAVDEFSRTTARGYVPLLDQYFDHIVMLQMEGKNADQVANVLDEQKKRLLALEQQAEQLEASAAGDIDGRIKEVEQLVAEGDRDSVDLADQMVRLMTRQIDQVETHSQKDKIKINFDARMATMQQIIKTDEHRVEMAALQNEFQSAMEREDYAVAEAKYKAADDLLFRAEMKTLRFWQGILGWLYQMFTELNMLQMGQAQFNDAAQIMNNEDRLQSLIAICMELMNMLPPEKREQFPKAPGGSGPVSNVM